MVYKYFERLAGNDFMELLKYKIVKIEKATEKIKIFTLEPLEKKLEFKAGQFTMLHILDSDGNSLDKRPYSIPASPNSKSLEFCIKILPDGRFTQKLDKLKIGAMVAVEGALGHFHYTGENNSVFISGGTGIAPSVGMLRYIDENKIKGNFTLFYSARSRDMILYKKEFKRLSKNPNINVIITLTREEPSGWKGECGRLNQEMLERHVPNLKNSHFYICGPLKLTMNLRDCLIKKGVKKDHILFEGWG